MMDLRKLLVEICGDEGILEEGIDIIESGYLDSFAIVELLSALEDEGIEIHLTQMDRSIFHSLEKLENWVKELTR